MLIDKAIVTVRSGKGGNGAISFRTEKNVPKGGPDGGNGGHGGSVYFEAKSEINTLLAYRHSKLIAAEDGDKGDKCMRYGLSKEDVTAYVPVGTVITLEDGTFIADLKHKGDRVRVAKGGRGGRGNASFKTSRNRIPRVAENGFPGEEKRLVLELKLLADAGLIGFPSVGKSTLLNIVSKANVATADYPFTTLVPNLGVVNLDDGINSFVLADMPGLIKGASLGKGLGFTFLRHIERCRVLLHMVSMSGERDPYEDYLTINEELEGYGCGLEERPQIIVATKMDEEGAEQRKKDFEKKVGLPVIGISALTDENVSLLMKKTFELIGKTPEFPLKGMKGEEEGGMKIYDARLDKIEGPFTLVHPKDDLWVITGEEVTREYSLINVSTDQGIAKLISYLNKIGVDEELARRGAKEGDTVKLVDFEFTYSE